jgi:8-oxo-dGTP pyrophosphatase MutT (NUDIX family)
MAHYVGEVSEHAVLINGEGKVLLLIHKGPAPHLKGKRHLPGGRMEMNDTPGLGLLREIEEETGITGVELVLPCSARRWGNEKPVKYAVAYLARVSGVPAVVLPPHEDHEDYEWATPDDVLKREFIVPEISNVVADVIKWGRVLKVIA